MLVLVNGLPFFSKKMVKDLNEFDSSNKYVFCNTYESTIDRIKFILLLPFCSYVISFNGVSDHSTSLDWVLRFRKKMIMQWHGTDVMLAAKRAKKGMINRKYIDASRHLIAAPWFKDELADVIEDVQYAPIGYVDSRNTAAGTYSEIKCLTYLAAGREDFYGWQYVKFLAETHPEIQFTVVGSKGQMDDVPMNVEFLGFIAEDVLFDLMKEHAIFIRLTEHDGKAITISQALMTGAEVIWSYSIKNVHQVKRNNHDVNGVFIHCMNLINARGLARNVENQEYAKHYLSRSTVVNSYIEKLKEAIRE